MEFKAFVIEALKTIVPLALAYIGVLKTRTDLDRYIAGHRSQVTGKPVEECIRRKWYQRLNKGQRRRTKDGSGSDRVVAVEDDR